MVSVRPHKSLIGGSNPSPATTLQPTKQNMKPIEMFKFRHIFAGDDHIGKYNSQTRIVTLRDEFAAMADEVKAYFMRHHGIFLAAVNIGTEKMQTEKPILPFPPEVEAMKSLQLGERTPAVIEWARKNLTREEFNLRYRGDVDYSTDPAPESEDQDSDQDSDDDGDAKSSPKAPKAPKAPRAPRTPRNPKSNPEPSEV